MSSEGTKQQIDVDRIVQGVSKPAYYAGGEWNSASKNWESVRVRLCLAFPDMYEIGMSNLGIQILYELVNDIPWMMADRCFVPRPDMAEKLRREAQPLFGIESRRALEEFDMLGISLPYELGATGVLELLDLGRVPIIARDRDESHPIVVGGGASLVNPEPVAEFFDVIVVGEGEEVLPELLQRLERFKKRNLREWRKKYLVEISELDGVYIPSLYEAQYGEDDAYEGLLPIDESIPKQIERVHVDLEKYSGALKPVVPSGETVFDRASVEIHRGCARGCRFCQAGFIDRPVRKRSSQKVREIAQAVIKATGHRDLTLLSLNAVDYRDIQTLIKGIREDASDPNLEINIPSTRVEPFNVEIAESLRPDGKSRKGSMTFAPEAASDRMRKVIHKEIPDDELLETVNMTFQQGWHTVKLYFMIGLPTETTEDVMAIAHLAKRVLQLGRQHHGGRAKVRVGVSTFVPKAHTPFQWCPQELPGSIHEKQSLLRKELRDKGIKLNWNDPDHSVIEALLSLGDRRVSKAIKRAWELGSRLDSWDEWFDIRVWRRACEECGIDIGKYVHRERQQDEVFPWAHIHTHTPSWVLRWEHDRALAAAMGRDDRLAVAPYATP